MAVKVITDSISDLPADLANELGITIVPANVLFGTREYKDGVDITADEFFDKLMNGPDFPTTSQPSVGEFLDTYTAVSDGADGIVSVHVSSKVSGTFNSARQGAEHANPGCPVEVLDTLQASMGVGLIAIAAARAAQAGGSIEEVTAVARSAIERCQFMALLDTLEYLQKGGRIGKAQALVGTLLKVKPIIILLDGEVNNLAKERTRRKAVARLRREVEEFSPLDSIAVMYSTSRDEADRLAADVESLVTSGESPTVVQIGPVLGTYAGPDALGVSLLTAAG